MNSCSSWAPKLVNLIMSLCRSNTCYAPAGSSCATPDCIIAYGAFATAAAKHFAGHTIIFETVNEPNGMGGDNSTVITALAKAAGPAIKAAGFMFVGPTTAGMDWGYLNATFADGILTAYTGVSV